MQQLERRYTNGIEAQAGKLIGYAAVFDSRSHDLGGLVEVIRPTAFTRTLRENPDVRALVDHDASKVLGRTAAGTLRLEVDERGLRVEIDPPDTTAARDLLESVRRGDVDGMSFAFRVPKGGHEIDYGGDIPTRYLLDVDLREISVVTFPAYPDARVALRALEEGKTDPLALHRLRLELAEIS